SFSFVLLGQPSPDPQNPPHAALNAASDGYFRALQIPLVRGRSFNGKDTSTTPRVAVNTLSRSRPIRRSICATGRFRPTLSGRNFCFEQSWFSRSGPTAILRLWHEVFSPKFIR